MRSLKCGPVSTTRTSHISSPHQGQRGRSATNTIEVKAKSECGMARSVPRRLVKPGCRRSCSRSADLASYCFLKSAIDQSGHWNRTSHGLFAISAYDPIETLVAASALDAVSSPFQSNRLSRVGPHAACFLRSRNFGRGCGLFHVILRREGNDAVSG